jgi:hypothetical protein
MSIGRGWMVLFLIAGALLLGAYWIGPLRPVPAELELLAIEGDVALGEVTVEPRRTSDGTIVFPVPLAVRNVGAQAARPARVVLSLPGQFDVATRRGRLTGDVTTGIPLRRFAIALDRTQLEPGTGTRVLAGLDTIYIVPALSRYYCEIQGLDVPEFSPAPEYDAETLSNVRIFYSFSDAAQTERQTGLLTVHLDPAVLDVEPAARPPLFRTVTQEPQARAPDTGVLAFAGARTAHCGDPEQPVQLYTVLWETTDGGHVFVIYVDNVGRKRLYDLNRDGIIELETWDGDADGRFESRREARYAVPEFLLPLPPRDPSLRQPDPERPDSAWLAMFNSPQQGPMRFARSGLSAHPQPVAVVDSVPTDGARDAAQATPPAPGTPARPLADDDLADVPPPTARFLALFADTSAGPFRFSTRPRRPAAPTAAASDSRADSAATAAAQVEVEDTAAPPPRPRRRQPLGTPIVPPR